MRWVPEKLMRRALVVLLALLALFTGCRSFDKAWAKAAEEPVAKTNILGGWSGTWTSEVNGHDGALRCVVTQERDGIFSARFHAVYHKVMGFAYTVPLHTIETNGVFQFSGEANLGWWAGGVYHYEGYSNETNFFSTYSCNYDHGTFQMTRPPHPAAARTSGLQ
jgi:hypothetical protein